MSKKKKTETGPSEYSKPHIDRALAATNDAVSSNKGNLSDISNNLNGVLGTATERFNDNSLYDAGEGYLKDVIGGKYLEGNPHLDQFITNARGDTQDQLSAVFGSAGRFGSGAHNETAARGLNESELNLRYQNYNDEQNRIGQAISQIPSLNQSQYSGLGEIIGASGAAAEIPYLGANTLARNTQGLVGNFGTTTQTQGFGSTLAGLAGTGLAAWAGGGFK